MPLELKLKETNRSGMDIWAYGPVVFTCRRGPNGSFIIEHMELDDVPGILTIAESGLRVLSGHCTRLETTLKDGFWSRMRLAGIIGGYHQHILEAALSVVGTHMTNSSDVRRVTKARCHAGKKTLIEAVVGSEQLQALKDFAQLAGDVKWALIGGLAISVYGHPRFTQDVDILVLSEEDIEKLAERVSSKFVHHRSHALEHKSTGIEIEILSPQFIGQSLTLVTNAINAAESQVLGAHSVPVVTPRYLAALKLQRASFKDFADIEQLVQHYGPFDMDNLQLSDKAMSNWREFQKQTTKSKE